MTASLVVKPKNVNRLYGYLRKGTPVVMLYHMKDCPHCVMMRPAWNECKQIVKRMKDNVMVCIAEVEYSDMHCLPQGFQGIDGFPTIKVYKNNQAFEYQGNRTKDSIMDFITSYMVVEKPKPVKVVKPVDRKRNANPLKRDATRDAAKKPRRSKA